MAKKSRKIKNNKSVTKLNNKEKMVSNDEIKNLTKIIIIICGILLVFYFITILVQKDDKSNNNIDDTNAVIQYDKIIVGEILNRKETEYYVLVEKENDPYIELYTQYLNNNDKLTYYTVNLSEIFNQYSISDQTFVEGNEVESYKFSGTTLIKVNNGNLTSAYKNKEEILKYLKSL